MFTALRWIGDATAILLPVLAAVYFYPGSPLRKIARVLD